MIIDAKNAVVGRLASNSAKVLLNGEKVIIMNAGKAIITGEPLVTKQKYMRINRIGSPRHGPFLHKAPDKILRRVIRGMIPYKKTKGKNAMKRLSVFVGIPANLGEIKGNEQVATFTKSIKSNFIYLEDVSRSLGWKG
ncbi:MAG: 50S ribosomal protein L13 [Candidatus Aenigmatarchaeota archaeon]